MSGWLSRLFDPTVLPQDYSAPANQLGPLAQQVMRNPVGTETTSPYASQSVGVPSGPFNPIEAMTSSGQPILGTDMDRARAAVAQGMQEAPAMVLGMVGDAPGGKGFTAYHGSPHSFDAFDTAAIGTGEGAQAYGHGLYFADKEAIARGYRDTLSPQTISLDGVPVAEKDLDRAFARKVEAITGNASLADTISINTTQALRTGRLGDLETALQDAENLSPMARQGWEAALSHAREYNVERAPGHMYEVNINAPPEHFLDWDKPLSEQSEHVQDALVANAHLFEHPLPWTGQAPSPLEGSLGGREGGYFMRDLEDRRGSEYAAQALRDAGIPGIRYLDAGSRGVGEGTRNTVIFDPATIEILRKYGIAGLMAGGAGAIAGTQQPQQ